jgi:hypothetical protein
MEEQMISDRKKITEEPIGPNQYRCALCGGVFDKGWSDEEAKAEMEQNFPGMKADQEDLVCDPCYQALPIEQLSERWKNNDR